jgi:hypothetical protein
LPFKCKLQRYSVARQIIAKVGGCTTRTQCSAAGLHLKGKL